MLHPERKIISHTGENIEEIKNKQKEFFLQGRMRSLEARLAYLEALKKAIVAHEDEIIAALAADLGKSRFEAYIADIGLVLEEIKYAQKNLAKWMKKRRVGTPMAFMPSSSYVVPHALGQVLIIGPWNYPVQLLLAPLVGAIAAGNTSVLKPSELTPYSESVIAKLVAESLPEEVAAVFTGGVEMSQALLKESWDHIFFTGSTPVGKIVAKAAAETMSPVTLELGGKSPVFVTERANVDVAIKRIVYGKFFNAGQTCVSPDYLLVHESLRGRLVEGLKNEIQRVFSSNPKDAPHLARVVNERNVARLQKLLDPNKVVCGGEVDLETKFFAPTLLDDVSWDDEVMQDEIFGPILPVMYYSDFKDALREVEARDHPLAAYIFSESKAEQELFNASIRFGGGCINDTMMHVASHNLPFGGVGMSGQGAYHGKYSFDTFSHYKGIMKNPTQVDLPVRYPPYTNWKEKILSFLLG